MTKITKEDLTKSINELTKVLPANIDTGKKDFCSSILLNDNSVLISVVITSDKELINNIINNFIQPNKKEA